MPTPSAPYGFTATTSGTNTIDLFGYAGDDYSSVRLYYSTDGSSYSFFRSISGVLAAGETFSYADSPIPENQRYYYYATGVQGANESAASDADSAAFWTEEITIYVSLAPTPTAAAAIAVSETASVGASVNQSVAVAYVDSVTASVGVAASTDSAQSIRNDYAHYLGDVTGKVHTFSAAEKAFNGASINSYWTSKITDFSELDLSLFGRWKTIYWAKIKYVDKSASTPVILSVSVDNGTWVPFAQQSIGTGSGGHKDAYFHMVKTGKYFQFKVEWPSSDKSFQFTGLEVALQPLGEEFKTS